MGLVRQDVIESTVDIFAEVQAVWELASEPGWYINGGAIAPHRIEIDGVFSMVHDAIYGKFVFETVTLDAPHYAAFRSLGGDDWDDPVPNTLVEFWVEATNAGVTRLRVMESGLAAFDEEEHGRVISTKTQGWTAEMLAAQRHLSRP